MRIAERADDLRTNGLRTVALAVLASLLPLALGCVPSGRKVSELAGDPGSDASPADAYAAFLDLWAILNPTPGQQHQRCSQCHSGSGPGKPDHSNDDPTKAYAAALTVINTSDPPNSRIYQQATQHQPNVGVKQVDDGELATLLRWIQLEKLVKEGAGSGSGVAVAPLLSKRQPRYAEALNSAALRIAQVPAHVSELLDIDAQADAAAQKARYEKYIDAYLLPDASAIDAAMANGTKRPGVVQNVFYNPNLWPGYPSPPPADETQDVFALTALDFNDSAHQGILRMYPSALERLGLQWVGFGGIRSAQNNITFMNQDNYGALDALLRTALQDRPLREAFASGDATRACMYVPYSGYQVPQMHRQVCRAGLEVEDESTSGTPVPGGILGSKSFQRIQSGHYKFHTVRALFKSFHCKDFPIYTNDRVNGSSDDMSRARVVQPWNQLGTSPYCASCHANSNLNLMALSFWRFDDANGVLRTGLVARRPTEEAVRGPTDIVAAGVDASKYYYKDQVLDSLEAWMKAFVDDPDFTRCSAAQIYNFAMGRGSAIDPEHLVPAAKVDQLIADYEAQYGAGSARDMTILKMLGVVFKSHDFTDR